MAMESPYSFALPPWESRLSLNPDQSLCPGTQSYGVNLVLASELSWGAI